MQSNEHDPCEKIILGFDSKWGYFETDLETWYKNGPGVTYPYTRPTNIYCGSDKRALTERVIDLEFRNNFLSQFLIACRLFPSPWNYDKADYPAPYWQMPELLSLLDGDMMPREFLSYEMRKETDVSQQVRIDYTILNSKTISIPIPDLYHAQFATLFAVPTVLLCDKTQSLNELLAEKASRQKPEQFILAIQQSRYWGEELIIPDEYLPNEDFSSIVSTKLAKKANYDFYSIQIDSMKYNVSILVFEAVLKFESTHALRCFGLASIGQAQLLSKQVERILDALEFK